MPIEADAPQLDHVALLVRSLAEISPRLERLGFELGPAQTFPREGTREVYAGGQGVSGRLLLVEAIDEGPYLRAVRERGPGLHHIAVAVPELEAYILALAGSGWYLLPQTLATAPASRTGWLARPGLPCLVEVQERSGALAREDVVSRVEVPNPTPKAELLKALGVDAVGASEDADAWITVSGRRLCVSALTA